MPAADDRRIPEALGKYQIIQRLAVGGMAELFLARITGLEGFEKYVAVKRILPQFAEDRHFVDMFLDEAQLAARLDHQNIVQVHDIGQEDGTYFFAMEYLHGEDVQGLLKAASRRDEGIPLEQALTIITGVAAGLQYAHEKLDTDGLPLHIVHRDVAPSNVIVTYDGGVKLVDFGIARAHFRRSQTEAGRVKGKLSYMSPEQCRGEELDARSDIFALGIVLYEITTMSRLFRVRRSNKLEVMERIVKGDIPLPSKRMPGYPAELEAIAMRALHISRKKRYQTAGELRHDLEEFAKHQGLSLSSLALARYLRETVGYQPEPWRVDRVQGLHTDTGKRRRDDEESRLPLRSPSSRADIPTPGRPQSVVSGAITMVDSSGSNTEATPIAAHPYKSRRRMVAILAGIAAILGILVAVVLWGPGNNSQASDQSSSAAESAAPDDTLELPADDLTTDDSVAEDDDAKKKAADAKRQRKRDRKAARSKKRRRSKTSENGSQKPKKSDSSESSTKTSNSDKKSRKKDDDRITAKKSDTKSATKATKTEKQPDKKPDEKPKKDTKESKKWDSNSPFPPSSTD